MSKKRRHKKWTITDDEERQEKVLRLMKHAGRVPIPPSGHYHDTSEKQRLRKERKQEKANLRNITKEFNNG